MITIVLLLVLPLAQASTYEYNYSVTGDCQETDKECKYVFVVESKLTMLNDGLVVPHQGKLYGVDDKNFTNPIDEDTIIQGDGYYQDTRQVIVVNNSLPGPAIEIFENQTVIVEVRNELLSEGVTIHWHGLLQWNNNLMDGVAYVNQCPILPGTSFRYTFQTKAGTYFYHAHIGAMRSQGLYGPLIARRRTQNRNKNDMFREYSMIVNDWNHDYDAVVAYLKIKNGIYNQDGERFKPNRLIDNSESVPFQWDSGLINGKGRYYDPATGTNNEAPLTVFKVKKNETVRFRVISAATYFPLRISVDQHDLTMIASDSHEFEDFYVESFILHPGERYDFLINATQTSGSYWIYAETLEAGPDGLPLSPPHRAEAIFEYEDNPMPDTNYDAHVETWSNRSHCTKDNVCNVLNCPFPRNFKLRDHQQCKYVTELTSTAEQPFPTDGEYEERFYNFAFAGTEGGSINGRHWVNPQFSAASQTRELKDIDTNCTSCNENQTCTCTNSEVLEHNKLYQLVLVSSGKGTGEGHPMHMHGHFFQVVKQGFFHPLDNATGKLPNAPLTSPDISCPGTTCNSARWANESWSGSGLDDHIKANPVLKDTVLIPPGGYTVVRLRANNPGFWYMHCHIELHNTAGMAMMFNEAPDQQTLERPSSFPLCGNFPSQYTLLPASTVAPSSAEVAEAAEQPLGKEGLSNLEIGLLIGMSVCFVIMNVFIILYCIAKKQALQRSSSVTAANQGAVDTELHQM